MNRYVLLLALSVPLLSCAVENTDVEAMKIREQIDRVMSGKSNLADRQYWRNILKWPDECESAFHYPDSVSGIDIYREGKDEFVVQVMCTMGSYQGRQNFFHLSVANEKVKAVMLAFSMYEISNGHAVLKEDVSEVSGNVLNQSTPKRFIILNRYSGYGQCGILTTYRIEDGNVRALSLRAQPDCELADGSRNPELWPEYPIR